MANRHKNPPFEAIRFIWEFAQDDLRGFPDLEGNLGEVRAWLARCGEDRPSKRMLRAKQQREADYREWEAETAYWEEVNGCGRTYNEDEEPLAEQETLQ